MQKKFNGSIRLPEALYTFYNIANKTQNQNKPYI